MTTYNFNSYKPPSPPVPYNFNYFQPHPVMAFNGTAMIHQHTYFQAGYQNHVYSIKE